MNDVTLALCQKKAEPTREYIETGVNEENYYVLASMNVQNRTFVSKICDNIALKDWINHVKTLVTFTAFKKPS